jgi:hypothetical protein
MPRDGSGIYTRPPGTNAVPDTTIESTKYNANVADVETDLNAPRPVIAGGTGANNAVDAAINLGVVSGKTAITYTDAEKEVARNNIAAAPFDAMAYNGMQINGSMEVSQEVGGGTVLLTPAGSNQSKYIIDGVRLAKSGTTIGLQAQQFTGTTNIPGFNNSMTVMVTAPQPTIGSDSVVLTIPIEGYRFKRANWGNAAAVPVTVAGWFKMPVAGNYPVRLINAAQTVAPYSNLVITTPNVAQYCVMTFSAQTTGVWLTTNGVGCSLEFFLASAGNINGVATNGNIFEFTGVIVLPGTQAPTAAQSPLIMRPYDQELATCQRYYWKEVYNTNQMITVMQAYSGSHANGGGIIFPVEMRAAPTFGSSVGTQFTLQAPAGGGGVISAITPGLIKSRVSFDDVTSTTSVWTAGQAVTLYANTLGAYFAFDARL